jgi:hypothetical protein
MIRIIGCQQRSEQSQYYQRSDDDESDNDYFAAKEHPSEAPETAYSGWSFLESHLYADFL